MISQLELELPLCDFNIAPPIFDLLLMSSTLFTKYLMQFFQFFGSFPFLQYFLITTLNEDLSGHVCIHLIIGLGNVINVLTDERA